MEPHLRQGDSALFAEFEHWDFERSQLPGYHAVLDRLRRIDESLHGGTKFHTMARYRLADRLYIAAPQGMIRKRELPPGWGLLECPENMLNEDVVQGTFETPAELQLRIKSTEYATRYKHRQRLLRNIAVSASKAAFYSAPSSTF